MSPALIVLLLALLLGLQPLTTDLYLPALPALTSHFAAPMGQAQLTLSALVLAFGISQLAWGPLSERFGRRPVLLAGLALMVAASIGCSLAQTLPALVLMQLNQRLASPIVALIDRWLRWLVFAFGAAYLCTAYELVDRPFWALAGAFFLVWFLGETLYNWLAISAHSLSTLPLFPRYSVNSTGEEWPVQPRLLKIREWLRAEGFRQVQALKAEIGGGVFLRV